MYQIWWIRESAKISSWQNLVMSTCICTHRYLKMSVQRGSTWYLPWLINIFFLLDKLWPNILSLPYKNKCYIYCNIFEVNLNISRWIKTWQLVFIFFFSLLPTFVVFFCSVYRFLVVFINDAPKYIYQKTSKNTLPRRTPIV